MEEAQIRELMESQLRHSRRLQARVRELEEERRAPLAVVGMGLRLPGGLDSPDAYWDFLRSGEDAYSALPEDRPGLRAVYDPVPGRAGRSYVDRAGFLSDIDRFDADFFGISQREARFLDPQQRMLLETAWEALERAGVAVRRSDRLDVGVYLGMMASEYSERFEDREDMTRIDPYYTTGGGLCFGAGRISFVNGFRGPVVSTDTACSSALTALHLAVRGLRNRECRYALVCGSNLLLSASLMVSLSQTRALSPEGRSKSFLATADGYGRGEGVGAVALMRLDDAEREGRPVLAVVRGSAVNHDGAASGLTAPNGPAQEEVIRAALDDAGVAPGELGWIEAHGTGTPLGDPIEVGALDGALGEAVRDRGTSLAIGSVKARIGHLEAASGIAALIKTVLMLQHGEIPAALSDQDGELNPRIPWDRLHFSVPRRSGPWPEALPRRVAGVNSFGMSGTNVHVVLEAYQPRQPASAGRPGIEERELLTLSAKNPAALSELADAVGGHLKNTGPDLLASVCHTLRSGRAPLAHRIAVTGTTGRELAEALAAASARPAAVSGNRLRAVSLLVRDLQAAEDAVTALSERYPSLAAAVPAAVGDDPANALSAMVGRFGLRVRTVRGDGGNREDLVTLEWTPQDGSRQTAPLVTRETHRTPELLAEALAALFTAGADLRLEALAAPDTRMAGDLPTYPFQRRRFWVDEGETGARRTAAGPASVQPDLPGPGDTDAVLAYLAAAMTDVLEASEPPDAALSFLDAGGDSFLSTLFITRVEEHYSFTLTAEDLPLDLPLSQLFTRLAKNISETATAAGTGGRRA